MQPRKTRRLVAAIAATMTLAAGALTAAPVLAADDTTTDYSRFAIAQGIYPGYPPCMALQETHGGACGLMLYFDCEGLFGPPAPCDDPDFWMYWS